MMLGSRRLQTATRALSRHFRATSPACSQNQGALPKGTWVTEEIAPGWRQQMLVDELMVEERDALGHRAVFKNQSLGDVMLIEDRIQLTSRDEHAYHEMFAHVPIMAHGNVSNVLIIGGGDGGTMREVLKHKGVRCTLVDIDPAIIEFSKRFLPTLHQGAWDNERATTIVDDGTKFVRETTEKFDVVIIDSTDPVPDGPSAVLYQEAFYKDCHSCLTPGGIIVTQNGHPMFESYPTVALSHLARVAAHTTLYQFCVPTYMGGLQSFGFATDDATLASLPAAELEKRWQATEITDTEHYTPSFGACSFVLPKWMQGVVDKAHSANEGRVEL